MRIDQEEKWASMKKLFFIYDIEGKLISQQSYFLYLFDFFTYHNYRIIAYFYNHEKTSWTEIAKLFKDCNLIVCYGSKNLLNKINCYIKKTKSKAVLTYLPCMNNEIKKNKYVRPKKNCFFRQEHPQVSLKYLAEFNDRCFFNTATMNFPNSIFINSLSLQNIINHVKQLVNVHHILSVSKPCNFTIEYDNNILKGDFVSCIILFSSSCKTNKNKLFSHKIFNIILIKKPSTFIDCIDTVKALVSKKYTSTSNIVYLNASIIKIHTNIFFEWLLDGENPILCKHINIFNYLSDIPLIFPYG